MAVEPLINIPNSPFVDIKTGRVSLEWLLWLQSPQFIKVFINTALSISSGGTGQSEPLTDGQLLIGATDSDALIPANITPVSRQTTVENGPGSITIGAAQDISQESAPTFSGLTIDGSVSVSGDSDLAQVFADILLVNGATDDGVNKVIIDGGLAVSDTIMLTSHTSFTNGSGASLGTLTNAPSVGNPTKWIGINDNGVTRYIPAW